MSSKTRPPFQSLTRRIGLASVLLGLALMSGAGATMPDGRPTPTGLEVPRWVTLKSSQVRARYGPGLDHRILWEYRAAGLPVQVIAETREWRKICDPEGSVAWIHRTVASGRRGAFNAAPTEVILRARPSATAAPRARLQPRSTLALERCEDGWCRVRTGKLRAWAPSATLFGVQEAAQCDAARPAGPAPALRAG